MTKKNYPKHLGNKLQKATQPYVQSGAHQYLTGIAYELNLKLSFQDAKKSAAETNYVPLRMTQVYGIFAVFAISLSVSFVVFLLEIANTFRFPFCFLLFIHLLIIYFRITE
jgi:hypothetical protein